MRKENKKIIETLRCCDYVNAKQIGLWISQPWPLKINMQLALVPKCTFDNRTKLYEVKRDSVGSF
jgi:hypothetical protein